MVVLGVIKLWSRDDLGGDLLVAGGRKLLLVRVPGGFGGSPLFIVGVVDPRAVLRADVVALTHPLCGIVVLPEDLQQLLVTDLLRIEDDEHDLGVIRRARAYF